MTEYPTSLAWDSVQYNGSLAHCEFRRVVKVTPAKFKKMDISREAQKWEVTCYDLGVVRYVVLTPKKVKSSNISENLIDPYIVQYNEGYASTRFHTLEAAKNFLQDLLSKGISASLVQEKPSKVESWTLVTREYKTKPKKVKAGSFLKEEHRYVFAGYAPC